MPLQNWRHEHDISMTPGIFSSTTQPPGRPSSFTPSRSGSIEATKPNKRKSWLADGRTKRLCFKTVGKIQVIHPPKVIPLETWKDWWFGSMFFSLFLLGGILGGSISYSKLIHFRTSTLIQIPFIPIPLVPFISKGFQIKVIIKTGSK